MTTLRGHIPYEQIDHKGLLLLSYAFGTRSHFGDGFRPNQSTANVRLLIAHDRRRDATGAVKDLVISEDHRGVSFAAEIRNTPDGLWLANLVRRGGLGCSPRYSYDLKDTTTRTIAGREIVAISNALLEEISIVARPAIPNTKLWLENDDVAAIQRNNRSRPHGPGLTVGF